MRLHLREHMNQEFLTISQLRALRKQLKYFESKEHTPTPGQSADLTPPDRSRNSLLSPPSSSSSSDSSDTEEEEVNQQRRLNFNGTIVTYTIIPAGAESYDLLQLFSGPKNLINVMYHCRS